MDDLTVRLVVVGAAVVAVAVFSYVWKRLRARPRRRIDATGLRPGVYLFTSGGCDECAQARRLLADRVGEGGYVELAWEVDPAVFDRLGITVVPSTMVVHPDGSGTWHAGVPRSI